jgi:hypothetical protein
MKNSFWHAYRSISAGQTGSVDVTKREPKTAGDTINEDRPNRLVLPFLLPNFSLANETARPWC